jgi:hypothetical protein
MNNSGLAALFGVQLVQVTLCIIAAALLSLGCLRRRPAFAAAVWIVVLCKCATPPVWASPLGVFSWLRAEKPPAPSPLPSWIEWKAPAPRPEIAFPEQVPTTAVIHSTRSFAWSSAWPWLLAGSWAAGFAWTFARAFTLRRRWLAAAVEGCAPPTSVVRAVARWSERLRLAPPRIVMVAADAGPAASGWLRPTVYLPVGVDPQPLEAMLVHELVHVRRRDPWLGALQAFVCAAYWFHPGVRWASDELSRCIEEACDAETVRELGCRPAEYAAALVALLERRVAPSVPMVAGMTPARSVRRRLEAVMTTNPKRRGRSARGPWLAFAAATLIALPGAGLPPSPPKEKPESHPTILPNPVATAVVTAVPPTAAPPKPVELKNFSHRGYDLKPAIDVLVKRCGLKEDAACNAVVNFMLDVAQRFGPRPIFTIANQRLFVFAAGTQHQWMSGMIAVMAAENFCDQVVIESEIWNAPPTALEELPFGTAGADKDVAFLAEADYQAFSRHASSNRGVSRLCAPRVKAGNGQTMRVEIASGPVVHGKEKDGKPIVTPVGVTLTLEPRCGRDGNPFSLKIGFQERKIADYSSPNAPIVNGTSMETMIKAAWDKRVAIKTPTNALLVFKCRRVPKGAPDASAFNVNPPGDGRLQAGTDPRLREAHELFQQRVKGRMNDAATYPVAVAQLWRDPAAAEQETAELARALGALLKVPTVGRDDDGMPICLRIHDGVLVTPRSRELHDAVARMIRDVTPRTGRESGTAGAARQTRSSN